MKRIVVIGGGFAGALVAKKIQKSCDLTLIDTKPYFEFTPSILKTVRDPKTIQKIRVPHKKYLTHATIVEGTVTKITATKVYVGKKTIPYDYVVIATGWSYGFIDYAVPAYSINAVEKNLNKIEKAKKVLLIGGGAVGVELAAELPNKKTIIVDKSKHLLMRLPAKAGAYAKKYLQKKGVKIVHNHAITSHNGIFVTDKNKEVPADIAFLCTGFLPNSKLLKYFDPKALNAKGFIEVTPSFQLKNHKNIFAVGNITTISQEKSAQNAEREANHLVKNIKKILRGKELQPFIPKEGPMVISLGPYDGLFVYKNLTLTGLFPALLKKIIELKTVWRYKYL